MAEFKGTNGKWVVEYKPSRDYSLYYVKDSISRNIIGQFNGHTHEEILSNAVLFSKSPEMLDFINRISGEMLRNDFVLEEKWYEQAQQLIKEATEI